MQRIGASIVAGSSWLLAVVRVVRYLRRESAGPPPREALAEPTPGRELARRCRGRSQISRLATARAAAVYF